MPHAVTYWECNTCVERFEHTWVGKMIANTHEATHHAVTEADDLCLCGRNFHTRRGLLQHIDAPGRAR